MNTIYNQLNAKLSPERKAALKKAQLTWLKFRDENANFAALAYKGGSIQPLIYSTNLESTTRDRTRQLRNALKEENEK